MKIAPTVAMAAAVMGAAFPDALECASTNSVVVSMDGLRDLGASDMSLIATAQRVASGMFAKAGVRIEWHTGQKSSPAEALVVWLGEHNQHRQQPEALAYALPLDGRTIVVLYDRVKERREPAKASILLAHVLAHEITHLLQGVARHSPSGVMKARWDDVDYWNMWQKPLEFAAVDLDLLHRGLQARVRGAGTLECQWEGVGQAPGLRRAPSPLGTTSPSGLRGRCRPGACPTASQDFHQYRCATNAPRNTHACSHGPSAHGRG